MVPSISSILQEQPDFKTLELRLWEEAAKAVRAELTRVLEALDSALMAQRPAGLRHCGWKRRVIESLIGRVEIRRRRYREELATGERRWRYLLDEAVGLLPEVTVSPGLRDRAVEAAVRVPYRRAAAEVARVRPDGWGPSHGAIHRWVCQIGEQRIEREAGQVADLFEDGVVPPTSGDRVEVLFAEADEVRVALQGSKRHRRPGEVLPRRRARRGEVRLLVAHRGWERRHPGSAEYRLARKHVYGAVAGAEGFWRGAVLSLHGYCALEQVRYAVLNGDGAGWIRQGIEYLPNCEFQLDRWHLWQAVKTGLSEQPVAQHQVYGVIQGSGEWAALDAVLRQARQGASGEQRAAVDRLHRYLWENRDGLLEYRRRGLPVVVEASWRGLGAAEANVDKPWAERLTKRGMSWGRGLAPLVRLMSLDRQGALQAWLEVCGWRAFQPEVREAMRTVVRKSRGEEAGGWLEVRLPALAGARSQLRRTLRDVRRPA
ncbi:MAG: ISLre2 family transposase [Deltaproteobacteria bacterium]|nr:ISLre2 family transposase [Deltaproteobacteria bacterium]